MTMRPIFLALAIVASTSVHAGCKELGAAITAAEKDIAYETARRQARFDPSDGPRVPDSLAAIQINATLMVLAKCPPRPDPVSADGTAYLLAASRCVMPGRGPESCDRAKWQRE